MAEVYVANTADLRSGDRRIVNAGGREIGVFIENGRYFAYSNLCLHSSGPACEGIVIPKVEDVLAADRTFRGQRFNEKEMHFVCPWHGWEYELESGTCVADRRLKLKKFEVVEKNGAIFVIV